MYVCMYVWRRKGLLDHPLIIIHYLENDHVSLYQIPQRYDITKCVIDSMTHTDWSPCDRTLQRHPAEWSYNRRRSIRCFRKVAVFRLSLFTSFTRIYPPHIITNCFDQTWNRDQEARHLQHVHHHGGHTYADIHPRHTYIYIHQLHTDIYVHQTQTLTTPI